MKLTAQNLKELEEFLRETHRRIEEAIELIADAAEKSCRIETACRGGQKALKDDIGEPIMGSK